MATVMFKHELVGDLVIDTGIDNAEWSYGLNTATFPTYGGEVVQILSVYIDDLTLKGTATTYAQIQTIYEFFGSYLQIATQGNDPTPNIGDSVSGHAYNLYPVYFTYPERGWFFKLYPKSVPGFHLGRDVVAPTWQISAHVIDDSPDLDLIKDGLKALATKQLIDGGALTLKGQISPQQGNPDTDPFETYSSGATQQQQIIQKYSDYYNSLIPAYSQGDFAALTAGIGSKPNIGQRNTKQPPNTINVPVPPSAPGAGSGPGSPHKPPIVTPPSHNTLYQQTFNTVFNAVWEHYKTGGCAEVLRNSNIAFYYDPKKYSSDSVVATASRDALAAFERPPYNCPLSI